MSGAGAGVVVLTGCALVPGAALYRQLFPGEWCSVVILTGCALVPGAALYRQLFPGEWCWCRGGDPDWVCPGARCRPLSPAVPR